MESKKVSIIIPVYNVEEYLKECLNSIVNQIYTNLEIIIVNDGSTDECRKICEEYARNDKRIKLINKENAGLGMARNTGLERASGDYICFVDSDDYIDLNLVSICVSEMMTKELDVLIFDFMKFDEQRQWQEKCALNKDRYESKEILNLLLEDVLGSQIWKFMFTKDAWGGLRFSSHSFGEDISTTYKVFTVNFKIKYLSKELYYYRIRGGSLSHLGQMKNQITLYRVLLDRVDYCVHNYSEGIDVSFVLMLRTALNIYNNCLGNSSDELLDEVIKKECLTSIIEYAKNKRMFIVKSNLPTICKMEIILLTFSVRLYNCLYNAIVLMRKKQSIQDRK